MQWVKNPKQACINGEMSFDAVGTFVKAKAFGLNTGIAGILHGLRVNHQQRCPLGFFFDLFTHLLVHVRRSSVPEQLLHPATACSANIRLSRAADIPGKSCQLQPFLSW